VSLPICTIFYLGKKYCSKDSEKDKGKDLEKKVED
jgi:hypothetical protein